MAKSIFVPHFCFLALLSSIILLAQSFEGVSAQSSAIVISRAVPSELNPPFIPGYPSTGGAPHATPEQAAAFAWQEFIALNWPAGPQEGKSGQRDTASSSCHFGDPGCKGPTVWQTFRGKVEIFPGQGAPPGYPSLGQSDSYGYDQLPQYIYGKDFGKGSIASCDPAQANDSPPWVNLDETDQILLDSMYSGVTSAADSQGNSAPQLIRFLAKANRAEYLYVTKNSSSTDPTNQWWAKIPQSVVTATINYLENIQESPPAGDQNLVSLPNGTIEIKSAWRPLSASEVRSGRFHMQVVRFYEPVPGSGSTGGVCYRDATWGLTALHIIQKTPSAPYFVYATFEQADNILTFDGKRVEDTDGNQQKPFPATATTPQICLQDNQPAPGQTQQAKVIITDNPKTCQPAKKTEDCSAPGKRLYYRNESNGGSVVSPVGINICVNKRDNEIPEYVINANKQAHSAISKYLEQYKVSTAPWLFYKLINVQYYPYDKEVSEDTATPNGSLYTSDRPYSAAHPAPSSFYQANIVVETNRALQLFSGGLTLSGEGVSSDWMAGGAAKKNTYYAGNFYNAGGCLGCHGAQGQIPFALNQVGDFSVILARGRVDLPEIPAQPIPGGMARVPRNRSLSPE